MRRAQTVSLTLALALVLPAARADWRLGAESGALFQSNLSNSDRAADEKSDWAWKTTARIGNGIQLSRDLRFSFDADLRSFVWDRFEAFDEIGAGVSAGLRYRFGLGRQAPWILLENRIGFDRFNETSLDGWDESVQLRGGFALSPRLACEGSYAFHNFAAPGNFFDRQSHRLAARLILDLTARLQVGAGYSYRNGDIISYAVPPRPDLAQIAPVRRGEDNFGTHPLYNAYRIEAETHALEVALAYSLTRSLSVELGYEYAVTVRDSLRYENHVVEAKIAFAY